MKNRILRVGTVVPSLRIGDVSYNVQAIKECMHAQAACDLLVFPELSLTGYTCGDLFLQQALLEHVEIGLSALAAETEKQPGLCAVVGAPLRHEGALYNCAVYLNAGKVIAVIPKTYIPAYGEFYEARWFTSGKEKTGSFIRLNGCSIPFGTDVLPKDFELDFSIGTDICEDLWVADKPSTHASAAGASVLVNLSASDEIIGKEDYRRSCVLQQSGACPAAYIYASAGPDESSTDLVFSGHCLIAENGRLLREMIFPQPGQALTALIDLDVLDHDRLVHAVTDTVCAKNMRFVELHVGQRKEATVEEMRDTWTLARQIPARLPFVPEKDSVLQERGTAILRIQANGLATRLKKTGIRTVVLGISGGLDSTLALLAVYETKKLVPDLRIITVTMPKSGSTSSLTYANALALMERMHTEKRVIEIDEGVAHHLEAIGHGRHYQGEGDVVYENAQARMRTYILMDIANMENGLVVGTGDLSELALGWCTYNGDHMSMYNVNASVPKTLVRCICRTYAKACRDERLKEILLAITDTPISPELTPAENGTITQKTENVIGKYDLNDFFLYWLLRYGTKPTKILALAMAAYPELEKEAVRKALERFLKRFFSQQFKRSCMPDGPKVGSVTLSPRGDWRMPSDASVSLWLEDLKNA